MELQEFEKYENLKNHIKRMAISGSLGGGSDWNRFLIDLNDALKNAAVSNYTKNDVLNILEKRNNDAFNNQFHKNEFRELKCAIDTIYKLVPPSIFEK